MSDLEESMARPSPQKRELLLRRLAPEKSLSQIALRPRPRTFHTVPLSFAQQRLWFLHQLEPNSAAYNLTAAYRLVGQLDATALEQAINEIVRRHEVLRTTFAVVDGEPVQVVAPSLIVPLPIADLRSLPRDEGEAEALRLVGEEAHSPFDLSRGPLLRARLLRLCDEEHVLILNMHHIVSDDWSSGVFRGELSALYAAFRQRRPSPLPELPVQYADFASWLYPECQQPSTRPADPSFMDTPRGRLHLEVRAP